MEMKDLLNGAKCIMCNVDLACTSQGLCFKCNCEVLIAKFEVEMKELGLSDERIESLLRSEGLK